MRCLLLRMENVWFCEESLCSLLALGLLYFRALRHSLMEKLKKRWRSAISGRSCLGCCAKATPIIAVDEPSKGLKIQGRIVKTSNLSEDFWGTSSYEMENSGVQSQSVSSISTSNQAVDHHAAGSTSNPPELINHEAAVPRREEVNCSEPIEFCSRQKPMTVGLLLWIQTRQQWIGKKQSENRAQRIREPRLSWNATYESLLGTSKPFPQPIPLSEMVDFLVDIWEQEEYV